MTIDDIVKVVNKSGYKRNIEITVDSCYSGKMCFKAKELCERKNHDLGFESLFIHAGTHKLKKAEWTRYRKVKMQADKQNIT